MHTIVKEWLESIKEKNFSKEEIYDLLKNQVNGDIVLRTGTSKAYNEYCVQNGFPFDGYMCRAWWVFEQLENIQPAVKKDIRVLIADGSRSSEYIDFLSERFNVSRVENGQECDLIIFTGGEDVDPKFYGQSVGKFTHYNTKRDSLESDIFYNYPNTVKLGICRGNQFLTVINGGKLVQHLNGHGGSHEIVFRDNTVFTVTSTHHQMAYPFDMNSDTYKIIGYSKHFKSDTYLNGNNEEIELPRDFVEVEIVKYRNCLGIQGHPEYSTATTEFRQTSLRLIDELIFNTEKFNKEINSKKEYYEV